MSTIAMTGEHELLTKARGSDRAGREAAFTALAQQVTPKLMSLCTNMLGSANDASDVVQEVLVLAHKALPLFRGDSKFSTWVFRIAVRQAIHFRAAHHRFIPLDDETEIGSYSADVQLEARDALRKTRVAMLKLNAEHRTVLSFFAIDGLGHAEIGQILGISEGTIWRRLHEARKALREAMQG